MSIACVRCGKYYVPLTAPNDGMCILCWYRWGLRPVVRPLWVNGRIFWPKEQA